jgi:acyl dehydratase
MTINFHVGDTLPPLKHTATPFQLFRFSAVTWNPHRIHFDERYAREEGHAGVALHSHLRAALALRCVAEGLGPGWHVTKVAYRLRKPVYAPADLAYTARVTATAGDTMTLEPDRAASLRRGGLRRDGIGQQDTGSDTMTSAPGRRQRPIRVGNCSGFYGDRASAMADMARAGGLDVLTGGYLAEVTMLILGKARAKDSTKGYAATFLQHLDAALEHLVANGIRLVVNAGGLNPAGLAAATRELVARRGYDLRVSHIEGDDVFARRDALQQAGHSLPHLTSGEPLSSWPHQPLTANAYLGGLGIARALHNGADIVITGRVADASLVVGAAAWWWSWTPDDHDALAGPVAAGHVIECGPQATGGNFSGFRTIPDLEQPGFPIAEIDCDGSSVITKNPGTGGAVTRDTVTAQLLYEIGEPAYLNPDVITHLDTAELTDLGDDRVRIHGVRGSAPPATTKVAITGVGGWQNSVLLALTGTDLDAKAALVERSVQAYTEAVDGIEAVAIERIGQAQPDPDSQNAGTELLRIAVQGTKDAAGRPCLFVADG